MHTVKRFAITVLEAAAEVLLLSLLLTALSVSQSEPLVYILVGSILALPVMLFLHGYYLTRVVAGIIARNAGSMVYSVVASALFATHMYVTFARMKSGLNAFGTALGPPFSLLGACVVFVCALTGNRVLKKWTRPGSDPHSTHYQHTSRVLW